MSKAIIWPLRSETWKRWEIGCKLVLFTDRKSTALSIFTKIGDLDRHYALFHIILQGWKSTASNSLKYTVRETKMWPRSLVLTVCGLRETTRTISAVAELLVSFAWWLACRDRRVQSEITAVWCQSFKAIKWTRVLSIG